MGLTINSKYRIATDTTMCAMPETGRCCSGPRSRSTNLCANHTCFVAALGFFCDVGGSYFLPRLANNNIAVGMYYALTGARLTGYDTLYVLARLLACLLALSLHVCLIFTAIHMPQCIGIGNTLCPNRSMGHTAFTTTKRQCRCTYRIASCRFASAPSSQRLGDSMGLYQQTLWPVECVGHCRFACFGLFRAGTQHVEIA
jgi:hypothetical protein